MVLILPASMRCFSETWRIANASRTGGKSITGTQQIVATPGGPWTARASFHLRSAQAITDARGFLAALDGQYGTFMAGPTDWRGQPWNVDPLTGGMITPGKALGSAQVDPAFQTNPDTTGVLDFSLSANTAMNATTINLRRDKGGLVRPGQYFQIGERLHIIAGLLTADPVGGNGQAVPGNITVQIRPWLRADYAAGTPLNFENPKCLMRMADADQGMIELTTSPLSDVSLSIVEAF